MSVVDAARPCAASAYASKPSPMRCGRASGPRWIQVLSTSTAPPASPVSDHLTTSRERREAASPRNDLDLAVRQERLHDVDPDRAQHPEVLGRSPVRLGDVVYRRVLEISRDRVETQAPGRVGVGQPNAVGDPKRPPRRRLRDEGLHPRDPTAASGPFSRRRARPRRSRDAQRGHARGCHGRRLRGSVSFRVGDERRDLEPGGTWRIAPNVLHEVHVGPEGAVVIDVFAPVREDWRALERLGARTPSWP